MSEDEIATDLAHKAPFSFNFLEALLLAIIRAHPTGDKTNETRLRTALLALTGEQFKNTFISNEKDDRALRFMAQEYHRDCSLPFPALRKHVREKTPICLPKPRSDLALAKEATDRFFDPACEQVRKSIQDRLREKFSGAYYRKQGKDDGVDFRMSYLYRANEHDYVAETLEDQSLKRICDELKKNGVATR